MELFTVEKNCTVTCSQLFLVLQIHFKRYPAPAQDLVGNLDTDVSFYSDSNPDSSFDSDSADGFFKDSCDEHFLLPESHFY